MWCEIKFKVKGKSSAPLTAFSWVRNGTTRGIAWCQIPAIININVFITERTEAEVDELACCRKSRGCWRPRALQSILYLTIFSSCFKIIIDNRKATYPVVPSQGSCQTKAIANSFLEGSTLWDGAHVDQTEQEEQRKTYSLVRLEKLVKAITNLVWMKKGIGFVATAEEVYIPGLWHLRGLFS